MTDMLFQLESLGFFGEQGKEIARQLRGRLPARVVCNGEGYALPPDQARAGHYAVPAIIFVRRDGWTLGAPAYLARVAYSLWADEWVGWYAGGAVLPIGELPLLDTWPW